MKGEEKKKFGGTAEHSPCQPYRVYVVVRYDNNWTRASAHSGAWYIYDALQVRGGGGEYNSAVYTPAGRRGHNARGWWLG